MDAAHVRAFLEALPDAPNDGRGIARVRGCLAAVQDPEVRYLVARLSGPDAALVARVAAAVLEAAGAPTGVLGLTVADVRVGDDPIDEALLSRAGTLAVTAVYDLHGSRPELGGSTRRDATVLLGLIAFAEAGRRVALLLDEAADVDDPLYAPKPDLVVLVGGSSALVRHALASAPDGCPTLTGRLDPDAEAEVEAWARRTDAQLLIGGRDHAVRSDGGRRAFVVRDEPFVVVDPVPGIPDETLSTGLATALALGAMGIRMREEWLLGGLDRLRGRDPVAT